MRRWCEAGGYFVLPHIHKHTHTLMHEREIINAYAVMFNYVNTAARLQPAVYVNVQFDAFSLLLLLHFVGCQSAMRCSKTMYTYKASPMRFSIENSRRRSIVVLARYVRFALCARVALAACNNE